MTNPTPRDIADQILQYAYNTLISNQYSLSICTKELIQAYIDALRLEATELEDEMPDICPCPVCNSNIKEIDPSKPLTLTDIIQDHVKKMIDRNKDDKKSRDDFILGSAIDDLLEDKDNERE